MSRFRMGVNYWPRRSAMYMWERFDLGEMREDFTHMRDLGFDTLRFFLMWEAFAPYRDTIDPTALSHFEAMMQAIAQARLVAIPTLFCGHMSGVNWLPRWTLDSHTLHGRFRTIADGTTSPYGIGDFYADRELLAAQLRLARAVGERVTHHPALLAWDLGNEFSNMRAPRTASDAAAWSAALCDELAAASGAGCTAGLHGEDFEQDRKIRPSSITKPLAFAAMHGYPVYATFSRGSADTSVVPFYCALAQSFSRKPVLFSEFGNPQCPPGESDVNGMGCLDEEAMATYASEVLARLRARGAIGALWWCWADYDLALASLPPFDRAPHELRFGIVRSDGSEKPVARVLSDFARSSPIVDDDARAPIADERAYYDSLPQGVRSTYREYCRLYG